MYAESEGYMNLNEMTYWELNKLSRQINFELLSRGWMWILGAVVIMGVVIYFKEWR